MALTVYKFNELVSNIATAMQARANAALDFTVGSTLRALAEAHAGVVLWLQAIILQLLTLTRAATSSGTDLDTYNADFGLSRLAAARATGLVTFSRFTPTMQALVPVGAGVQTADGSQKFTVTANPASPAFNATLAGYIIAAGTTSVTVPVIAAKPGTQGNVQAGTVTQLTGGIPYVDTATNAAAFINGIDAESDPAFRARFVLYLASLSKSTRAAIEYAVRSLQQGVTVQVLENKNFDNSPNLGHFTVIVDDGTGSPSAGLLTNAYNAIDAARALTVSFAVFPPLVVSVNIGLTLATAANSNHAAVVAAVSGALGRFINAIPLGSGLPYSQIASVVYGVPGVVNATGILLNGATADIPADKRTKLIAGTLAVA